LTRALRPRSLSDLPLSRYWRFRVPRHFGDAALTIVGMAVDRVFCAGCGEPLPPRPPGKRGPSQKWCSERCRWRAKDRARHAGREPVVWASVPATRLPAPVDSRSRREAELRAVAAMLDGERAQLAPIDQLGEATVIAREVTWSLRRLGREDGLPGPLQAAAGRAAEHFDAGLAVLEGAHSW
jgi:hypothetical protein